MHATFLGKIPFAKALSLESEAFVRVQGGGGPEVLAFETGPVITLGVRGGSEDLEWSAETLDQRGFEVHRLERGGQATLHNPGQLVIFPIFDIRLYGARAWVDLLLRVSAACLREFGKEAGCRFGQPGLYTSKGKITAIGIRIRHGISTHGLSINVSNDLGDFRSIRACGVSHAVLDRIGPKASLEAVFMCWIRNFKHELTTRGNLTNLECSSSDVRL